MPDDGSYTVGLLSLVEATPPLDRPLARLRRLHQPRLASSVDFLPPSCFFKSSQIPKPCDAVDGSNNGLTARVSDAGLVNF